MSKTTANVPPLGEAVWKGDVKSASILIEKGSKTDVVSKDGQSLLHVAVHDNHVEVVDVLLRYKIDLNAKNKDGNTPLMVASKMGYEKIALLLLKNNADANALNNVNVVPIVAALNISIITVLLENGADINIRDKKGEYSPNELRTEIGKSGSD